jgi:hypothetical protein
MALLAVATIASCVLGAFLGLFTMFAISFNGRMGIAVPPACMMSGAVAGVVASAPLAWWFRSAGGLAIGAGVGVTLGLVVMPFV